MTQGQQTGTGEIKTVTWAWFEAGTPPKPTRHSMCTETQQSNHFKPSLESLAVFDEIKAVTHKSRSDALTNLKSISNINASDPESCGPGFSSITARSWFGPCCSKKPSGKERADKVNVHNEVSSPGRRVMFENRSNVFTSRTDGSSNNGSGGYGMGQQNALATIVCQNRVEAGTPQRPAGKSSLNVSPRSEHFTPSAESLAIFDEIKSEVHQSRSAAVTNLKSVPNANSYDFGKDILSPTMTHTGRSWFAPLVPQKPFEKQLAGNGEVRQDVRWQGMKGTIGNRSGSVIPKETRDMENGTFGNEKDKLFDRGLKLSSHESGTKKGKVLGMKKLERKGETDKPGNKTGFSTLRRKVVRQMKTFGPKTLAEMRAEEWKQQVLAHQKRLQGEPPKNYELWDRHHVPFQLRSSKPSVASGASNGWELNDVFVRRMAAKMRRNGSQREGKPKGMMKRWWSRVDNGVRRIVDSVASRMRSLWKMMRTLLCSSQTIIA
ncbi:hypothetical protein FGB62_124g019 [Gracilaria domingensis]|nr:hypothetical protein FGB62_124g019 [Gracilaria domingensis]